jgi:D-alanyl-D-alanine carboxypeptidase/D-alanyl-D-alanine-endopeptidase (penicillin-binding protein 4)
LTLCDARYMRFAVLLISALACMAADLERQLDALADSVPGHGLAGISVVDLATGKPIYRRNDDKLLQPASNMKLFTSALALLRLGPEYRFTTQVLRESSGDLVLVGGGDPTLSGREFPYRKDAPAHPPLQAIEDLADQVLASGIHRINGDVIGDDRLYPWAPYPPNWTQDDALRDYGAPVSALTVSDNTIGLAIRPGAKAGELAELTLEPAFEYFAIDNRIVTVEHGSEAKIRMSRAAGSRQLLMWGSIPAGSTTIRESVAMDDPALYAAGALYDALTRRGVAIAGIPVARHRLATDDYLTSTGTVVAARTSPPLTDILQMMDKVSQNLYAELMLREVGRFTRRTGTREAGAEEMAALVSEIGAPPSESRIDDGSGLSRNAIVTPRTITRLLAHLYGTRYREAWISLLPVGGEDGTLAHRLCCVSDGRGIRAKTGSLSRALALSGYADSKTRGRLAFSILVNDFSAPPAEIRAWIDKIATSLLE